MVNTFKTTRGIVVVLILERMVEALLKMRCRVVVLSLSLKGRVVVTLRMFRGRVFRAFFLMKREYQ